jgi:amidohydrolase
MAIINRIGEFQGDLQAWRRDLHAHPEIAFEERRTAEVVARRLRSFGVDEVHTGIARTGVVGVLRAGSGERAIGLRADMDALPIEEDTGAPYTSTLPGKMHACGHDGHTTMLLGAARYLAETRNFDGTVYLIFQPAEEGAGGGRAMVEEGLLERFPAERVFGLHNWPGLPLGTFAMCKGPAMAAADTFEIRLRGQGCHAAMPHLGRDPVTAAAQLVQALQTFVAREVDPVEQIVVSVCRLRAGDTHNVIPETAELWGTVRVFKTELRDLAERRLGEIAAGIAGAMGIEAATTYRRGYPPTVNNEIEAALGADAAAEIVGEANVFRDPPPCMGAEDFAFMLERCPGAYIWMGAGREGANPTLHSPRFDFNDEALTIGASWWARLAERLLPREGTR